MVLALLVVAPACTDRSEPALGGGLGSQPEAEGLDAASPDGSPSERSTRAERILDAILKGEGNYVVLPQERYLPMWDEPGSKDHDYVLDTRNPNGGRSPMLIAGAGAEVDDEDRAWFEVYLPIRPNGSTGWVSQDDVRVQERRDRLEVDLSKRTLRHYRDGELVDRFVVAVGQPRYPTAVGTFYVWVKVRYEDPTGIYGALALGLSGFSPVLSDWPGGGRMAVHGTTNPSDRGEAVSHGCVRVYNPQLMALADVPLGTPVVIRP